MKNRIWILAIAATALVAAGCGSATQADAKETASESAESAPAAKEFKVEIGESASQAKKVKEHDLTEEALKEGRTEYMAKVSDAQSYKFTLTEKQIEDLLGGTTVIVETVEGGMKVKVGPSEKKSKDSGW